MEDEGTKLPLIVVSQEHDVSAPPVSKKDMMAHFIQMTEHDGGFGNPLATAGNLGDGLTPLTNTENITDDRSAACGKPHES